jgi:hypothetical protein
MNKSVIFIFISLGFIVGVVGSTCLYLPYVGIKDDVYVVDSTTLSDVSMSSIDCAMVRKKMLQHEIVAVDASIDKVSAYINKETPANQPTDLHLLSVYEGLPVVRVKKTKKPTRLFLSSGEDTIWTIQLEEDAKLDKIYILDRVREIRISKVANKDYVSKFKRIFLSESSPLEEIEIEKIKVEKRTKCKTYGLRWHPDRNGKFRSFLGVVRKLAGQIESTYQGKYHYNEYSLPFQVPVSKDRVDGDLSTRSNGNKQIDVISKSDRYPEVITGPDKLIEFIQLLMSKGVIPESLPSRAKGISGRLMEYENIKLSEIKKINIDKNGDVQCNTMGMALVAGDDKSNIIECSRGDHVIFAGGGKDVIESGWGNDIVYGGKGDDVFDTGWGSDIFIFNQGWGNDIVDKACHFSRYRKSATLGAAEKKYSWEFTNFIVFGPNIDKKDIIWRENKLINTITGDTIEIKHKCFNYVFFEDPVPITRTTLHQ